MYNILSILLFLLFANVAPAYSDTKFTTSVPLLIDGQYFSTIFVRPDANDSEFLLELKPCMDALLSRLSDEIMDRLKTSHQNATSITLKDLNNAGIPASFNESSLELQLSIPAEKRKISNLYAVEGRGFDNSRKLTSAPWSGYFNIRGGESFRYGEGHSIRAPVLISGNLVTNYKNFVLQNEVDYLERRDVSFLRQSTQLVHDVESKMLRVTAGDLNFQTAGFQVGRGLGGISIVSEKTIAGKSIFGSGVDRQFFLKRQSTVEIKINGSVTKRVMLSSGAHNLKELPLIPGANQIELRITDDLGQIELIKIPILYDLHLLGGGIHEYGYATGFTSSNLDTSGKTYSEDKGVFSGFHRYGAKNYWTPGVNFQIDPSGAMGGIENRFLTTIGYWSIDIAQSGQKELNDSFGSSSAIRLRHEGLQYNNNKIASFNMNSGVEMRGYNFLAPGELKATNPGRWNWDIGVQKQGIANISVGINFRMNSNWNENNIGKNLGIDLKKRWGDWQAGAIYNISKQNTTDHQLLLTLNWYDLPGQSIVLTSHESSTKTTRLEWSRNLDKKLNSFRANGALQRAPTNSLAELNLAQTREKLEFNFQQRSATGTRKNVGVHQSSLHFGTAFAWTDKGVGMTRPIADSFAMIGEAPGANNLDGIEIGINKSADGAQANIKDGDPAILPELQSYTDMPINIDMRNLPVGYSLGPEFVVVRPTYHSGVSVVLDTAKSVMVTGTLKNMKGEPLKLHTGIVRVPGRSDRAIITFFTDELGRYFIEGIQDPVFQVVLDSEKYSPTEVEVPPNAMGIVSLPDLIMKEIP